MTNTHNALDLAIQAPSPSRHGTLRPPATDIWWSRLETSSNLFTRGHLLVISVGQNRRPIQTCSLGHPQKLTSSSNWSNRYGWCEQVVWILLGCFLVKISFTIAACIRPPSTQNGTKWKYQKKCSSERVKCLVFGYYTGTVTVIVTFLLSAPPADTPRADTPPGQTTRGAESASVHAGIHPQADTPLGRHPRRRLMQRTVRILLVCILVKCYFHWHLFFFLHSCEVLFSLASFFLFHKFSNYKLMYFLLVTTDFNFCKFLFPNNFYL